MHVYHYYYYYYYYDYHAYVHFKMPFVNNVCHHYYQIMPMFTSRCLCSQFGKCIQLYTYGLCAKTNWGQGMLFIWARPHVIDVYIYIYIYVRTYTYII